MFRFATFLLLCVCLLGCSAEPIKIVTATPHHSIGTLVSVAQEDSTLPPLSVARQQTIPATASPEPTEAPQPCLLSPDVNTRSQYIVDATLDWSTHSAEVEQQFIYINTTGIVLDRLLFQVEPNRDAGFFVLHGVSTDHPIEDIGLIPGTMTVPLPQSLQPGCQVTLNIAYLLRLPPVLDGYYGHLGYLGFTDRQINLGHWMPVLALHKDDWYAPQFYFLGEQTITESSDFDVTLEIVNAPPTIDVAAPGSVQGVGENRWRFQLSQARDLTIAIGNGFRRTSQLADDGTLIELYYYPESTAATGLNAAGHALKVSTEALVLYEELFGIAYPYKRLVIVEGDFPDGMEFSGLVYVSEAWFRTWRGESTEWLTIITVHEIAHQWWYALVGNDPAENPYLDEAFATYSEYLYFQRYYGDKTEWWWDFRVRGYAVEEDHVDRNIYQYDNARPYINAVYLRGAQMLHTMRTDLGDEAFFAWLKSYTTANQYHIATPQDLWGQLTPEQYAESLPVRQRFFIQWGILSEEIESAGAAPTETPSG